MNKERDVKGIVSDFTEKNHSLVDSMRLSIGKDYKDFLGICAVLGVIGQGEEDDN